MTPASQDCPNTTLCEDQFSGKIQHKKKKDKNVTTKRTPKELPVTRVCLLRGLKS